MGVACHAAAGYGLLIDWTDERFSEFDQENGVYEFAEDFCTRWDVSFFIFGSYDHPHLAVGKFVATDDLNYPSAPLNFATPPLLLESLLGLIAATYGLEPARFLLGGSVD